MAADQTFGRELEEDHDLLTYNESGARLREEIESTRSALQEPSSCGDLDEVTRTRLQRRLQQLEETADRNSKLAVNDTHAAGFLRYSGPGSTLDD